MGRPSKYNLADCKKDALGYQTKKDWAKASPKFVSAARRNNGWYEECTKHMISALIGAPRKWTPEKCKESSSHHTNVTDWKSEDYAAYAAAKRYNWLSAVTTHFKPIGNHYSRLLYICRIRNTKLVYVGLSANFKKRVSSHRASKRFSEIAAEHGDNSIRFFKLTDNINADKAAKLESLLIEKYRARGFTLLNRKKGGGLGGSPSKWTYETVKIDAGLYEHIGEWSMKSHAAYTTALQNDWLNKLIEQGVIKRLNNEKGFWTLCRIKETAINSNSRKEWRTNYPVAYDKAVELDIHNDESLTSHFESSFKYKDRDEKIRDEIAKYETLKAFREGAPSLYSTLKKQKLLNKFTKTLKRGRRLTPWSETDVIDEAKLYFSKTDFQKNGKGAYAAAKRLGCFEEATRHMKRPKRNS